MTDESDIRDVAAKERSRLKPAAADAARKQAKRVRQAQKLLERGTEADVMRAIRAAGLRDDSPEALKILRIWRENRYE